MRKIYTLTFHRVLNYGAVLQAYALIRYLEEEGLEARNLNYLPWYFLWQVYRPAKSLRRTIQKLKKICYFSQFCKEHLKITSASFFTSKSFERINDASVFICGSDQIWNKNLTRKNLDDGFFLKHIKNKHKKISYAASAGSARLINSKDEVRPLLESFDAIGVREDILADDIKKISSKLDPTVVVDPCLLIKDYSAVEICTRVPNYNYIVSYVVGSGESLESFDNYIFKLKEMMGIPVVHIGAKPIASADRSFFDLAPGEWVAFIKKARFVATNSFHGTAFSINFEKQFLFFPNCIDNLNSRQETLLRNLGLMDRYVRSIDRLNYKCLEELEYSVVSQRLKSLVDQSKKFLLKSINI